MNEAQYEVLTFFPEKYFSINKTFKVKIQMHNNITNFYEL